jgi:hypothetical protein
MKSVYVNGIENNAIDISDNERLIKNFFNSRDDFFPIINTIKTIVLPQNEIIAVPL